MQLLNRPSFLVFKAHHSEHCWKQPWRLLEDNSSFTFLILMKYVFILNVSLIFSVWDPLVQWWLSTLSIFKYLARPLCLSTAVRLHHKESWSHLVMSVRNSSFYTVKWSHQCWTAVACCCLLIWSPLPPKSAPASCKCNYFSSFYSNACTCHRYLPEFWEYKS